MKEISRRGSFEILVCLQDGPKNFSELASKVGGSYSTIKRRTDELSQLGLIDRRKGGDFPFEDAFKLTEKGHTVASLLRKLKDRVGGEPDKIGTGLLKELMGAFIDDVVRGIELSEAGRVRTDEPEADLLVELGIAERDGKGIRHSVGEANLYKVLDYVDEEKVKELVSVCLEIGRAAEMKSRISLLAGELPESPKLVGKMVYLGWRRMLKTSEFPVVFDEVVKGEGFSPDRWYIKAPKTSDELALSVANKYWEVDFDEHDFLRKFLPQVLPPSKSEWTDRVKKVVRWEKALGRITRDDSAFLAFLWFADDLLSSEGLHHPEAVTFFQGGAWKILERYAGAERLEITENLREMVGRLPLQRSDRPRVGWEGIVRLPW